MSRYYQASPIVEAVCEFRFTNDTDWDNTIYGLLYDKLKDHFPKKSSTMNNIVYEQDGASKEPAVFFDNRSVFSSTDNAAQVQSGNRILSIMQLKPYQTWEKFKNNIDISIEALKSNIDIKGIKRIGLRYINEINLKQKEFKLEDCINFRPYHTDQNLLKSVTSFRLSAELPFFNGRDICRVQFTSRTPEPEMNTHVLDFDYFLNESQSVAPEGISNWIEEAHNEVESLFESCITDKLRELFKEKKR